MRKHVQWYLQKMTELSDAEWRGSFVREFNRLTEASAQVDYLDRLMPELAA
jgi:tRNA-dihydrouridine synthase